MENVKKAFVNNITSDLYDSDHTLTSSSGRPIVNNLYSVTAGSTGPTLVQDVDLFDKLQHFDREQIPQRNVHALGTGVYGTFTATKDISKYSCARVFNAGEKTDLFARFSGIFTEKGEAETIRDPRGFAMKFYTQEGNWDLLTINTPVFNVRDTKIGPDAIHAFKRDTRSHEWNSNTIWDFVVNHPESLHQTLMIFTDRVGTPSSFRNMNTYGCNTFSLINEQGVRHWVKFHLLSHLDPLGLDVEQAKIIAGEDPDFLSRDLRLAIQNNNFPKWTLSIQVMPEAEGYKYPWTFDCTKIWPHKDFPLIEIGTIELNRIPTNFHAEVEQVAFSPSNVVRGIGFSPDRLLQGRLFLYPDTQYHRLGSNYRQLPINAPHVELNTPFTGGHHNMEVGKNKFPGYYPSCFGGPTVACTKPEQCNAFEPPTRCAEAATYYKFEGEGSYSDYFEQPKAFLDTLDSKAYNHLAINMALSLSKCSENVLVSGVLDLLRKVSEKFASQVDNEFKRILDGTSPNLTKSHKLAMTLGRNLQNNQFQILVE